jgi:hypothetical protein
MLSKFLGPETIIHGAAMFKKWEKTKPIALVVSDWDEGFLEDFLESLLHDQHPFTEIVVMRPENAIKVPQGLLMYLESTYGITVKFVEREYDDFMDWCEAPVNAEWFMYLNSYFAIRKYVDLLLTDDDKPLVIATLRLFLKKSFLFVTHTHTHETYMELFFLYLM